MLLDLLTLAVLAWVGSRLVISARIAVGGSGRRAATELLSGLRPRHFLLAVPVLGMVLVAASALVQVPGLDFGWWTAIGGEGNPVVGSTDRTAGSPLEWLVPAVFIALLIIALPLLVMREEQIFRAGSEDRTPAQRVGRGVVFGMAHALVGIPIGVALALSIGGWYFTLMYLRGWRAGGPDAALLESGRAHLAYNLTIVAIILVAVALGV
jgi:hypothetical protein